MKTQFIQRKALSEIFPKVCESWQKEITSLVLFQSGDKIEVQDDLILRAFNAANDDQKTFLKKHFEIKDSSEAFNKIKDYSSFCKYFGIKELELSDFKQFGDQAKKLFAFHKIKNFETCFNEGWIPDFNNTNQPKHYLYFEKVDGGWRLCVLYFYCFSGSVGLYKDEKTAIFIGETFKDVYLDII